MNNILLNFVKQVRSVGDAPTATLEDSYHSYVEYIRSKANHSKNFEYILRNPPILFDEETLTDKQHRYILSILRQNDDSLSTQLISLIKDVHEAVPVSIDDELKVRELLPQPIFENTFPFEKMRDVQKNLFERLDVYLSNPEITDIIIDAPTGVGKSGIAIAAMLHLGSGYLVTANKALQNQYVNEFSWLSDLRGRSNYRCNTYEGFDCKNSPCQKSKDSRKECSQEGSCDYGKAKYNALEESQFSLMNMHTLVSYGIYARNSIKPRRSLIIDEAHSFPEVIASSVGLSLRLKSLKQLGIKYIPVYENPTFYRSWLTDILKSIQEEEIELEDDDSQLEEKIKYILTQLDSDNLALDFERDNVDATVITALKLYPVRVEQYYQGIQQLGDIRIHLSATILAYETYCNMLGIESKNVAILRLGSPFPKEIRPIYVNHAVGGISAKTVHSLMPSIVNKVDYIMSHYSDYKGIIHGTTYAICNALYSGLSREARARVIFPKSSREQQECLRRHAESTNSVLLSPSMTEGVDLKNDLSRFQILVKTPYPYLGDPVLQKRKEIYPGYYEMLTAITIMQSYGRSTRHESDWSHTFVLDENFKWFVKSNSKIFPAWFLEAIVW